MDALRPIANWITSLELEHPTRVGLDGRSPAGKTTLADAVGEMVQAVPIAPCCERPLMTSIARATNSAPCARSGRRNPIYDEGYDYLAFRDVLLRPLGPGGSRRVRTAIFDSFHEVPVPVHRQVVPENAVLIVDGANLQRDELRGYWDYLIWLSVDSDTVLSRARERDVAWVGSVEVVDHRYRTRVLQAHTLYESLVDPKAHVDPYSTPAISALRDWSGLATLACSLMAW